jgi:hypothetical protein
MMEMKNKIRQYIVYKKSRILALFLDDKIFNKILYKRKYKKELDLYNPKTFSEKVIYLKIFYRNPLLTLCSDKYSVRQYVELCGYPEILKKLYGIYRKVDEIDISELPERFFVRCNHVSGGNYIVNQNEKIDYKQIWSHLNILLKTNYYYYFREWGYKNIFPCIICEELLLDSKGNLPVDYKFYCFSGEPKYLMVSYGEFEHKVRNHKFDMDFNSIDHFFKKETALDAKEIKKPDNFDKMVEIVRTLCHPFPHVRVDLYNIDGRIIFGELTFYSGGGFINVYSYEMDLEIGSWINLEKYGDFFRK